LRSAAAEPAMNTPQPPSYYDAYWRDRYDAVLFERRIRTFAKNYTAHLPPLRSARIVEIGPGYGEMLEFLARSGFNNLTALDNDGALIEALRQRGVRAALHADDATAFLQSRPGAFDCVVGMHVLEHFDGASGQALVAAAFSSLAPLGRLILEVPNMANFITAPYARWADYTHRQGYTIESLRALLLTVGFRIRASFGVARSIGSVGQLAGHAAQRCTDALAWLLLKANYPRVDVIAAPVIGIVAERPAISTAEAP
jgi:2-polyprenyl-3-methyl-5-hydroxy-6-metoxy-1,4-benzoquinol methylase